MKHTPIVVSLAAAALVTIGAGSATGQPRITTPPPARQTRPLPPPAASENRRPAVPAGTTAVASEYRVGPGDKLRIEVYKDAQLSQSVQIRPDGKITLPLVGDVAAAGKTPIELRDALVVELKEYVNNPVVTVIVVEALAASAFIIGAVNNPGAVPLQGRLTVLQGLALAGGLNDWAKERDIRVLRDGRTIPFDYRNAIRGAGPMVYLQAGDTVVVPD